MTKFMQSRSASITLEKAKAINEKAKAEGRPLTETEQSAFDALMAAHSEASLSTEDRIKQDPEYAAGLLNSVVGAYGPKLPGAGGNQPPMLFRTKDGEVVRAYRSTERLVSEPVKDMPSLGGFLAHMLTGKNEFLDGQMAVAAVPGTTASGSYLLSENLGERAQSSGRPHRPDGPADDDDRVGRIRSDRPLAA